MREKFITIVLVGITVGILVFFRFSFVGDIFVRFTEMLEQKVEELRMFGKESDASTEDDNIRSCLVSREATLAELRSAQLRILELRELLSFASSSPRTYLGADIVGAPLDALHTGVYINRGSRDGVRVGDAVLAKEGVLFGLVVDVLNNRSFVRLITDPRSKFAATVYNDQKSMGIVEGGFGAALQLTNIPQHENISAGDMVYTAPLSDTIPQGILIGRIVTVEKEPYEPFQRAVVEPYVETQHVSEVLVVIQ